MSLKPYKFSPDQRTLHAVWMKAFQDGELLIPCREKSDATKLRFALYNAVKPVREGRTDMQDLADAVSAVSVTVVPEGVRLQHRASTTMMQAVTAVLGNFQIEEAPVMSAEEVESLNRLQELLATPETPKRTTPFYKREIE